MPVLTQQEKNSIVIWSDLTADNIISLDASKNVVSDIDYAITTESGNTWSGPFGSPVSGSYTLVRTGNVVSLYMQPFSGAAAAGGPESIVSSVSIPASLAPAAGLQFPASVLSNSANAAGLVTISAGSAAIVITLADGSGFPNTGNAGFLGASISWTV